MTIISLRPRSRRGNYSVLLAVSMTVLLGFSALAIDLSYGRLVHTELQSAA
ncbi:MAG: Flp pilus assembly protein TadG, partial [Myxococcota bacterium]